MGVGLRDARTPAPGSLLSSAPSDGAVGATDQCRLRSVLTGREMVLSKATSGNIPSAAVACLPPQGIHFGR